MEQKLSASLGEPQIAEFIEDDEVEAREIISDAALATSAAFGLEPVDEVDGCEEASARSGADAASCDGDGSMRFSRSGSSDQDDVALLAMKPPAARSRTRA